MHDKEQHGRDPEERVERPAAEETEEEGLGQRLDERRGEDHPPPDAYPPDPPRDVRTHIDRPETVERKVARESVSQVQLVHDSVGDHVVFGEEGSVAGDASWWGREGAECWRGGGEAGEGGAAVEVGFANDTRVEGRCVLERWVVRSLRKV